LLKINFFLIILFFSSFLLLLILFCYFINYRTFLLVVLQFYLLLFFAPSQSRTRALLIALICLVQSLSALTSRQSQLFSRMREAGNCSYINKMFPNNIFFVSHIFNFHLRSWKMKNFWKILNLINSYSRITT